MRAHLLLLSAGLLLASCATTKPVANASSPPPAPTYYPAPDSGTTPEAVGRVRRPQWLSPFGAKAITKTTKSGPDSVAKKGLFGFITGKKSGNKTDNSKCKNCTVVNNYGNGNHTSAHKEQTGKQKVSGSSSVASDEGTSNTATKAGAKGGAAALGEGSTATATTKKAGAPFWLYAVLTAIIFLCGLWVGVNLAPNLAWLRRPKLIAGMGVAFLLLLSTEASAQSTKQLNRPFFRYRYSESRQTERYIIHQRRQYKRRERQEFAVLRREHHERQRYYNRHHRRKG